jgi:DNA-binding beta-propeller fold protein YncE
MSLVDQPLSDVDVPAEPESGAPSPQSRPKVVLLWVLCIALVLLCLVAGWYLLTRKPLSELPGINSADLPAYQGSALGVQQPLGVALSPDQEQFYVTESEGARQVKVFDRDGNAMGSLTPPASEGKAHIPTYVAVDPATGEVYVSDRLTRAIYIYDSQGEYLRKFNPGVKLTKKWEPLALVFTPAGNLLVSDVVEPQTVREFQTDGQLVREIGQPGETSYANGLAVDAAGNVVVSDSNHGRVVIYRPDNTIVAQINRGAGTGELSMPRGVVIDDRQRLYVVDVINQDVSVYDMTDLGTGAPKYLGVLGMEGIGDGEFEFPNGVAADTRGRIYVTDRVNNRVQIWSY